MKKEIENEMADELLSEYDFAQMEGGVKVHCLYILKGF